MKSTLRDSFGGLFCGDAAGATLEFYKGPISETRAFNAMKMPGGGQLNVAPGQVTDDSELAISLATVLFKTSVSNGFPLDDIARSYIKWNKSDPFDCDLTCRRTLGEFHGTEENLGMKLIQRSIQVSSSSETNGALMRVAPIAIWASYHKLSVHVTAAYAKLDAMLTHPSQICQDCNALYCVALSEIIKRNPNPEMAIDTFLESHNIHPTVLKWYEIAKTPDAFKQLNCNINIGHVKYGFVMAIHFAVFIKEYNYEKGITKVLTMGGDTDTNAAICGAVLGALHGVPVYMSNPVLSFNPSIHDPKVSLMGYKRPLQYSPMHLMQTLTNII
jgi:ADP-ribosylglycohydrolase